MKKLICVFSTLVIVLGWLVVAQNIVGTNVEFKNNVQLAEKSIQQGLFEQGVDYYYKALAIKKDDELLKGIKEAYHAFYNQQKNEYSYTRYIESLKTCCGAFGQDRLLWEELISVAYNQNKISDAFSYIKQAKRNGIESDTISKIEHSIYCIFRVDYKNAKEYTTGKNSTYSVTNENSSWVMRFNGDTIGIGYKYVGPLDENGRGIFVDNSGSTIRDFSQITRVLLPEDIQKSGYYNSGFVPVQINDKWYYYDENGEIRLGPFDMACSMCNNSCAVLKENKWQILMSDGNALISDLFDSVAFDQYCCHTDGNKFIASIGGQYSIYDSMGQKNVDLAEVDDISVGSFSDWFAYKEKGSGLWGFMDFNGQVIIEPTYSNAKGFSNGYAAVSNEDGLWGVVNTDGEIVINYEFYYVGFFTPEENCIVSRTEGALGILTFTYR